MLAFISVLILTVSSAGCIHERRIEIESGQHQANLTDSQCDVLLHLKTITESQNRAITSFNDREYVICQGECEQLRRENREFALSIESFEHSVADAMLSGSDETYYDAQLSILRAIHHSINESASDIYSACEYAARGDDSHARYHIRRASKYVDALYANIDRFNENVDVSNRGSGDFAYPVPEPPNIPNEPFFEEDDLADIPDPYYLHKARFQNTPDEVKRLLGKGFLTPYQCSLFDCSEMAAYIEWKLECHNITAYIATKDDWRDGYGHAWVIVSLRSGRSLAIEPTVSAAEGSLGAEMITYDSEYFVYDHLFEDIYGAAEFFGVEEWDWWNKLELK